MSRIHWLLAAAVCAGMTGCVQRSMVIYSEPSGATVFVNGKPVGATPVDVPFLYHGKYHITLVKDGYQTLQIDEPLRAKWYEYFPIDVISEAFLPINITDRRRLPAAPDGAGGESVAYQLVPVAAPRTDELQERAQNLRQEGVALRQPEPIPVEEPTPVQPAASWQSGPTRPKP